MEDTTTLGCGRIQWKGTDVCMDIHCMCGARSHIDAEYAYNIRCSSCGKVYRCEPYITLVESEETEEAFIIDAIAWRE